MEQTAVNMRDGHYVTANIGSNNSLFLTMHVMHLSSLMKLTITEWKQTL
jgi:hypothetical protein